MGDQQFWEAGRRITVIVRGPESPEGAILLDKVYEMTEAQYRQYRVAKVFRAEATSGPRVVLSNDEVIDLVGVIGGAIGIVDADDVPAGLKILSIDGLKPGSPDYAFAE